MTVTCGIDWAENHHDVALVDEAGKLIAKRRITDNAVGYCQLLEVLAGAGDTAEAPIPVAIETSRGLLVACLRASGRTVYAINPLAVARYRDRYAVSRTKSDHVDALILANILRTDLAAHRPLPMDSELVRAIAILARAQQDAVWNKAQLANQLRSLLREYYPAFLTAFAKLEGGLTRPEARAVLAAAPTPTQAAKLTRSQLRAALKRAGRSRRLETEAERLRAIFHGDCLHQLPQVEAAMGHQAHAILRQLVAACEAADELAKATTEAFMQHVDAPIITSFPGLGALTGARVLGELGDDRTRFSDARSLKAYAGSAPITRASGKSLAVLARKVKNQRLAAVGYVWAFAALLPSPGARAHYDRRKATGDRHVAAQRHLYNRLLGCLHHCLQTRQLYDEGTAFRAALKTAA